MSEETSERFLKTVAGYVKAFREGRELAHSLQRHEDVMIVWIIGLATGAVIALPALLNYIIDPKSISRLTLSLLLGPFVLAVIAGIAYRLVLANIMEADALFAFKKIHALESLRFSQFEATQKLDEPIKEVLAIMDDKPDTLARLKMNLDKYQRCGNRLRYWAYILFGIGVFGAATIAIFAR